MMPMTAGARWVCWWVWVGASFLAWHKQNKYKYKKQMQMQLQKQIQIQLLIQMRLVTAWGKVWALVGRVSPLGRSNHTDGTGPAGFCGSHEYDYERKYKYCSKCKYRFPLRPQSRKKSWVLYIQVGTSIHTSQAYWICSSGCQKFHLPIQSETARCRDLMICLHFPLLGFWSFILCGWWLLEVSIKTG